MRRYTVAVDGKTFTIDVEETTADRFEVSVGHLRFEAALRAEEDLPGAAISPEMLPAEDARPAPGALHPGLLETVPGPLPGPPAPTSAPVLASAEQRAPKPVRSEVLSSPMPGVVLQVLVKPGAVLRRGDSILVLEAMKMRNTIRAPRPATVVEIAVEAGQPVGPGEPLVRLAPAP